jgi:hypothetical protein
VTNGNQDLTGRRSSGSQLTLLTVLKCLTAEQGRAMTSGRAVPLRHQSSAHCLLHTVHCPKGAAPQLSDRSDRSDKFRVPNPESGAKIDSFESFDSLDSFDNSLTRITPLQPRLMRTFALQLGYPEYFMKLKQKIANLSLACYNASSYEYIKRKICYD